LAEAIVSNRQHRADQDDKLHVFATVESILNSASAGRRIELTCSYAPSPCARTCRWHS
jgi:hypothetical protein